jgi:hypothetical protein
MVVVVVPALMIMIVIVGVVRVRVHATPLRFLATAANRNHASDHGS